MQRRCCLIAMSALAGVPMLARGATDVAKGLRFPEDFGAHPATRTEWWYITGSLRHEARLFGFQITFFRSATGLAADSPSRFAAQQLVFAHAAVSDIEGKRLRHDQRIARAGFDIADAALGNTRLRLRDWRLDRAEGNGNGNGNGNGDANGPSRYRVSVASRNNAFAFDLSLEATSTPLLQGDSGLSHKGPSSGETSWYYSEPHLKTAGTLELDGRRLAVEGLAWLDHEWSDSFLPAGSVGWDWIGMNLDDGGALTAFRLRRADGTSVYAGGSLRSASGALRVFGPDEVRFTPQRAWRSATSGASYPVQWALETPAGRHRIDALLDAQELDSRNSTGAVYWEGLSDLLDGAGARVGRGYLEMTGYAGKLRV